MEVKSNETCRCIPSKESMEYCGRENQGIIKNVYVIKQENFVLRDIQQLINGGNSANISRDAVLSYIESEHLGIKGLDTEIYLTDAVKQIENTAHNHLTNDTKVNVELIKGKEAAAHINQDFARATTNHQDESSREITTSKKQNEKWLSNKQVWKARYFEEIERNNTYLDEGLYDPSLLGNEE